MTRWYRAAHFKALEAATQAVVRLQGLFDGRPEFVTYRFAIPGPLDSQLLIVAALARDIKDVTTLMDVETRTTLIRKGEPTYLPDVVLDHLFADWSTFPRNPLTLLASLTFRSSLDEIVEDSVAVTSHAKCRDCGQARHKIARLNLCQLCWEKVKPTVRRQWREIKDRRRLRRAVDEHIEEQHRARAAQAELRQLQEQANARREEPAVDLTAQEAAKIEIARLKAEGLVPKPNTPEFGPYMRLHQIARGVVGGRPPIPFELTANDRLMQELYLKSNVPVGRLEDVLGYDKNRLGRLRRELHLPLREDWQVKNPPTILIADHEQLVVRDGMAYFQDRLTSARRLAIESHANGTSTDAPPPAEPVAEAPALEEPAAQEPVAPVAIASPGFFDSPLTSRGTPRKRTLRARTPTQRAEEDAEIIRLYEDLSIPTDEICRAYNLSHGALDRILKRNHVLLRTQRPDWKKVRRYNKGKGRLELIDGKQTWVQGNAKQMHLGQAPGAEEMPVTPQQPLQDTVRHIVNDETRHNGPQAAPEAAQPTQMVPVAPQATDVVLSYSEPVWMVTYVSVATVALNAASIDGAIQLARQRLGADINIVNIQRDGGALWKSGG